MEVAYNELLEIGVTATHLININTPKKVQSLIAKEIQELWKSGSSDSEIVDFLLDTNGLTKPATPKNKDKETGVRLKRQDIIFTATPLPIKRVLQPDSNEMAKPQKQLGKTMEMERIPIKNKERPWSNDKNTTKSENNKFQQKIKIKNGKELIQKFPTKEKLGNEYLKEHYKENDLAVFEINKN